MYSLASTLLKPTYRSDDRAFSLEGEERKVSMMNVNLRAAFSYDATSTAAVWSADQNASVSTRPGNATFFTLNIFAQPQIDQSQGESAGHGITLWSTLEAQDRLKTASHAVAHSRLAPFYQPQAYRTYCGFASMAMALNVLHPVITRKPSRPAIHEDLVLTAHPHQKWRQLDDDWGDDNPSETSPDNSVFMGALEGIVTYVSPIEKFDQISLVNSTDEQGLKSKAVIKRRKAFKHSGIELNPGLSMADFKKVAAAHDAHAELHYVTDAESSITEATFISDLKTYLDDPDHVMIANFYGKSLGLKTGGHFSPIAAYDEATQSVLIMDVAGHRNPWFWVPVKELLSSMSVKDGDLPRGYMVVSRKQLSDEEADRFLSQLPEGETPIPGAPELVLEDSTVVPSQYLLFHHTQKTVQEIVARIGYDEHFRLFVGEENGGIYIQVGIVGKENYPPRAKDRPTKIVYGRKWRVEPNLPTSEIIQTALLALKTAEEHEAREMLTYGGRTIFNNHFDLPLMAKIFHGREESPKEGDVLKSNEDAQAILDKVRFAGLHMQLVGITRLSSGKYAYEIQLDGDASASSVATHFKGAIISFLSETTTASALLYRLMEAILTEVRKCVDDNFTFDEFPRFSEKTSTQSLREFLRFHRDMRNFHFTSASRTAFAEVEAPLNAAIYRTRIPRIQSGPSNDRHIRYLGSVENLHGSIPRPI